MNQIEVNFGETVFEKLITSLKPGQALSAGAILAALDDGGDAEEFEQLDFLCVPLDISDLPAAPASGEMALRLRREQQLADGGKLLQELEENDPLRLYLEELDSLSVCAEPQKLAAQLFAANANGREEPALWQDILNMSLPRVVEIACRYTGYGTLLLDLIQEGSMVLWQYLPRLRGESFEHFVQLRDACIHYAMKKTIILQAHANGIGQKMRQAMEDYRAVDEQLLSQLGRNPTTQEIADALHMTKEETQTVQRMIEAARAVSRVKEAAQPREETPEDQMAVEDTAYFRMRQRIAELLSTLSQEDAMLITLRYGLEGGLPLSPEETARKMGISAAEVTKREAAALTKLRNN